MTVKSLFGELQNTFNVLLHAPPTAKEKQDVNAFVRLDEV